MNKRAEIMGVLVVVVLGSLAIVMIALYLMILGPALEEEFTEQECRASLQLSKTIGKLESVRDTIVPMACTMVTSKATPLKCTRKFLFVEEERVYEHSPSGDDITRKYDDICPYNQASCLTENVLAEEMAACWKLFFTGNEPVLGQAEIAEARFWENKGIMRSCFVCAEVTVDEPLGKEDLLEYIYAAKYDEEKTYLEYFAASPLTQCSADLKSRVEDLPHPFNTCWWAMYMGHDFEFDKIQILENELNKIKWILGPAATMFISEDKPYFIWPSIENAYQDPDPQETYAITFIRRGLGSCADNKDLGKGPLTNAVFAIPSDEISNYCTTVII